MPGVNHLRLASAIVGGVAALALSGCAARERGADAVRTEFKARIESISPLTTYSGKVVPVSVDPRFAMTVVLLEPVPEWTCKTGEVVTLAIHSPSHLFGADEFLNQPYQIRLHGKRAESRGAYFYIEAERLSGDRWP